MTATDQPTQPELSPLKRALIAIDQMQAKLDAAERARHEPVAVVGMACRFPGGVDDPDSFWQLLVDGRDAITDVPADRWDIDSVYDPDPDAPGKMSTRRAGFIDDVAGFDPLFFGVAPREATSMDPQQRLLLEVAWEALEHAGIAPDRLVGSRTGVFLGMTTSDYSTVQREAVGLEGLDAYYTSGAAHSIASGRLSYVLGLQGPSITIDTACSSSLVAIHLAVQSVRSGESRLALAGGVNLILSPENSIMLSKFRMMAPDGICKAFDAAADGFVRGEGCGLVALKRWRDAVADGDRVLAVIRGSAANQDGASSGLTAPNGPSQEAVVRDALVDAGIAPRDVAYVEAHGTGTALGDPIEVQALAAVLGPGRDADAPLAIGSVKTNVGHLEAVAGVAGLIKAVLVLQHGQIPPHLHLHTPNPHIDWDAMPIVVPTTLTPLAPDRLRIAGVSAFGFSGTNAHVVLEAAPAVAQREEAPAVGDTRSAHVLTLSARTERALRELAGRHSRHLATHPELSIGDVCATANGGRARLDHRLAVVASDLDELRDRLAAVAAGDLPTGASMREVTATDPPRVAFLFTGQGSQTPGMASGLYAREPVFRSSLDRVVALFDAELAAAGVARSLGDVLLAAPGSAASELLDQTMYTQAALFAVELAMVDLWRSWGVSPSGVLGHSLGEIVGAVVAGVLSAEDGVRLVAARGRLMQALPEGGTMLAVFAPADEVESLVAAAVTAGAVLAVAAVNGPRHAVVSGAAADVAAIAERCTAEGRRVQALTVSHAFHSPLMQPMVEEFRRVASTLTYCPPRLRVISNVTGTVAGAELADPDYWVRHVLSPVRFAAGISALASMGFDTFVEVGPHPVLTGMGQDCVESSHATWVGSLRRSHDDHQQVAGALAALHLAGVDIDWRGVDAPHGTRRVALPTYPFERTPYWVRRRHRAAVRPTDGHPLLGSKHRSPLSTVTFESQLAVDSVRILADHRVFDTAILPATAFVEMALAAGRSVAAEPSLADVVIHEALIAPEDGIVTVQTILTPEAVGASFRIYSRAEGSEEWTTHVSGRIEAASARPVPTAPVDQVRARAERVVDAAAHEALMTERGLVFGPSLRNVRAVWIDRGEAVGEVTLSAPEAAEAGRYVVHPALLDAAIQVLADVASDGLDTYLPISIDRVSATGRGSAPVTAGRSHVALRPGTDLARRPATITADVVLIDDGGTAVATVEGLRLTRTDQAALRRLGRHDPAAGWLYEVAWRRVEQGEHDRGDAPEPGRLAAAATDEMDRLFAAHDLGHYQGLLDELESLSTDYIVAALGHLGVPSVAGTRFDTASLPVASQHRRLLAHLLDLLAADGLLRRVADGAWEVTRAHVADVGAARLDALRARYPDGEGELAITRRCGEQLAGALRGTVDPLELLFPGGSLDSAEQMYQLSPFARFYQSLASEVVAEAVAAMPDRPVRVLEIGAGTGGTSAHVLPRLRRDRVAYTYTDVSPHFLVRAREKFAEFPFVEYRALDIEGDLARQGFEGQRYDVVVAANVLHATADLRRTFANVARLLAPDGILAMVEMVRPQRFVSISFGLTEGWWKYDDPDVRPDSLLLSRPAWQRFLDAHGFADTEVVPPVSNDLPSALQVQSIVVARRDRSPATASAAGTSTSADRRWLVLADRASADPSVGDALVRALAARGQQAVVATPGTAFRALGEHRYELDPTDPAHFERLVETTGGTLDHVVHLWSLEAVSADAATVRDRARVPIGSALLLTRALATNGLAARSVWVTRGAQPVGGTTPDPLPALLWGFAKTVALEHPELRPVCIDLDPAIATVDAARLIDTIEGAATEDQLALRGADVHVARLVPAAPIVPVAPVELTFSDRGSLDHLAVAPLVRRAPGPGEVEIRVHATALNFKDVLNVLGMYPGDPGPLGGECAGTVVAVGDGVVGLPIGRRVVALAPGAFRSHVTCDGTFVVPLPDAISFEDGAGLLIANVTAGFALAHLGQLRRGERVLIHAAAGGVGLAAVGLAQRAGAEVYATAGTEAKRDHLRMLGVEHVYDSRSLDFAARIRDDTDGAGVDVVLNSLAGEFVTASLGLLREYGRFLEIGKRDHLTAEHANALGRDIAYHVIDWTEEARADPQLIRSLVDRVLADAGDGTVAPLPSRTFTFDDAPSAFRYMAQARHIGKVVIVQPAAAGDRPREIREDGTYLVTGGLTGLGLLTAQHLADRGARHLVLLGRRAPSASAADAIAALERDGVEVVVCAGDVADREDVRRTIETIGRELPPLRGVFHSAGALDPAAIGQMSWEQFGAVLAAKADGALLLDELTADAPLDHFVIYASIASLLGARGQANHSAANAFLDALAHRRAATGRVALSIDWGAWSDVGAAADRGVDKTVGDRGLGVIPPAVGLEVLDRLMGSCRVHVGVCPVDWGIALAHLGAAGSPAFFTEVARGAARPAATAPVAASIDLAARLADAPPERRLPMIVDVVRERAAHVLALSQAQVGDRTPLNDLGLDSLMAVELRNLLGSAIGTARPLPATLVFDYPTVEAIARFLADEVLAVTEDAPEVGAPAALAATAPAHRPGDGTLVSSLLDDLEHLSDDEIDEQLARRSRP